MIYKYLDENTLQPVTDGTLKFATVPDLNDPFENLGRVKISSTGLESQLSRIERKLEGLGLLNNLDKSARKNLISQVINQTRKDFDGSQHLTATLRLQTRLQESTARMFGILSLASSRKNGLMWSHYANKHQGYVLGLDESHEWFNPPKEAGKYLGRIVPISYSKVRVEISQTHQDMDTAFKPFFVKSEDWSYEEERRVLLPLKGCKAITPTLHLREYPPEMLKEVIFGYKCSEGTVTKIKEALKGRDILYSRAVPSSVSFDVEIESEENFCENLDQYEAKLKAQAEASGIDVSNLCLDE